VIKNRGGPPTPSKKHVIESPLLQLPKLTVGLFTRSDSPLTPAAAVMARGITAAGRKMARARLVASLSA
jgi:hypothetical protein